MEKKVVAIGNGLAVFIDKAYQRELGINANTLVRVYTDGVRLTIEPTGDRPKPRRLEPWDAPNFLAVTCAETSEERKTEYCAMQTMKDLLKRGFNDGHFARLHHYWDHIDFYWGFLCARPMGPDDEDRKSMRRIEICWERVATGATWDEAITHALADLPMDGSMKRSLRFGPRASAPSPGAAPAPSEDHPPPTAV